MTPPRSIPDAKRPMSRSPVLALGTQSGPPHPAGGGRGGSYNVLLGLEGTLAELRLEQLVQGAAGEAGGEERLRRSHDFPLPVGNLKGRTRGGSGVGQAWVRRGSGVGQAWVRGGSGVGQAWIRGVSGVDLPTSSLSRSIGHAAYPEKKLTSAARNSPRCTAACAWSRLPTMCVPMPGATSKPPAVGCGESTLQ